MRLQFTRYTRLSPRRNNFLTAATARHSACSFACSVAIFESFKRTSCSSFEILISRMSTVSRSSWMLWSFSASSSRRPSCCDGGGAHERLLALKRGGSTDPRLECGSCPFLQADVAPAEIGQRAAPQCLEKERMPRAAPGAGSSEATSKVAEQTTREDGQHASVACARAAPAGQHQHDEANSFARARAARRAALEAEKAELQAKIAEIESRLHGSDVSSTDEDEDHSLPAHRSRGTLAEWPNGAVRLPRTGSYHRLDVQQRQIDAKSKYVVGMKSGSAPGADSNNAGSQSPVLVEPVRQSGAAADARLDEAARDADDESAGGRRASRAPLTLPRWGNSRHNSLVPEANSGERLVGAVLQRSGSQGGRTLVRSGSCCDQTVRGG